MDPENKFLKRLATGKPLILAEGYIFELERRGYIAAGPFCPDIILDQPEIIKQITQDFVRCGSEVIMACTYYINRTKLKLVGRENEDLLHLINKQAIQIAKEVRNEPGNEHCLICGDISNTTSFKLNNEESAQETYKGFVEQARWAQEEGVDFIVIETMDSFEEAALALKAVKSVALPAVVNLSSFINGKTRDGLNVDDAFIKLKSLGADVVGINCQFGPQTIIPKIKQLRLVVEGPIAASNIANIFIYIQLVPVPYRTTNQNEGFMSFFDQTNPNQHAFPTRLEPFLCTRYDVADFAVEAVKAGAQLIGICCGNQPNFTRHLCEALGQQTKLSKYSPQMQKHVLFGENGVGKNDDYEERAQQLARLKIQE